MERNIFIVSAQIVDANGTFGFLQGYPKTFDSKNYGGDIEKARKRAEGDASDVWGDMCKIDTRKAQSVTMTDISGFLHFAKMDGSLYEPEPEQEQETEP